MWFYCVTHFILQTLQIIVGSVCYPETFIYEVIILCSQKKQHYVVQVALIQKLRAFTTLTRLLKIII